MSLGSEDDVKDMQVKNKRDNIKVGHIFDRNSPFLRKFSLPTISISKNETQKVNLQPKTKIFQYRS